MSFIFEQALQRKCETNGDLTLLQAQWAYDRRLVSDALQTVGWTFPHYSRHDVSHSNTILVQLARVLGEDRVAKLSATDVWLLLEAAYQHDIGMVVTDDQAREWLRSPAFATHLEQLRHGSDRDLASAAKLIVARPNLQNFAADWPLDLRRALTLVLADYGRQHHAKNAERIVRDPHSIGLLSPRTPLIPERLFRVLAAVCAHHGRSFEDTLLLPEREAGLGTDEAHPRFVACMLRLGDLLDLDNGRFCPVMMRGFGPLPPSSAAHAQKHAAIKHLEIGPMRVEVEAECESYDAYEVTEQWLAWLREELKSQMARWAEIAPSSDFGALPSLGRITANVRGYLALEPGRRPRFDVDREAFVALVTGANIYTDSYSSIRELVQNAVDATILRLWRENWSALPPEVLDQLEPKDMREALKGWPIRIHLEQCAASPDRWVISIEDQGTGIAFDEVRYLQRIGGSGKNPRRMYDLASMPEWMKPSGVFGIGLQSAFLLTDEVIITTRHHEEAGVLHIELRNGQGPSCDGLSIKRHEGRDIVRFPFGTKVKFKVDRFSSVNQEEPLEWLFSDEPKRPGCFERVHEIALALSSLSVCSIEFNGSSNRPPSEPIDLDRYFFDRDTGLVLSDIRASFAEQPVSVCYRGAPTRYKFSQQMLGMQCDAYFGRATELLKLSREHFTNEGRETLHERLNSATQRVIPHHIQRLRSKGGDNSRREELQACSLYAYLLRLDSRVTGDEWGDAHIPGDDGGLTLREIASRQYVTLEEGAWRATPPQGDIFIVSKKDCVIFRLDNSLAWSWMSTFLRRHFPRVIFDGYIPSSVFGDARGLRLHFATDKSLDAVTERGLHDLLANILELRPIGRAAALIGMRMPCANRYASLSIKEGLTIGDAQDVAPRWLGPRMVSPFLFDKGRIVLGDVRGLVEWTTKNASENTRSARDVAEAMWKFITDADLLMNAEWRGDVKGYSLDDAKRALFQWLS